ncbi:thiamine-phosphate kinase [Desulfovibrio sulfodismutans]|uniref:Thiamine-monophosphate kinase n=1 Tax=Desulfolutivibrio sulfodismutans TaxID=63561 RepID=A0A7K3NUE0_9BACT|nr:thiamine-phosphate kinase [Desulfolutivibrio sulfodismutans]NDY58869.1 thiamine-phosphate kinase [Desulfolutivibrio sulfodismutans]QLA10833.1 thiamine-phosphate kinase [Desulfolutivibrio sulfodismutans DSM 3696]
MSRIASEAAFLGLIDRHFPRRHGAVPLHRGDDAAVLDLPGRICLTADLFLEDAHFRRAYFTPGDIGYKALAVNLSDLAAMGASPLGFALVLTTPSDADADFWDGVFAGMAELADALDLPLVGGDLNRGPSVALAVTAWGGPGPSGRFLRRGQGRPGDALFLVGEVGLAAVGLAVLEASGRDAVAAWPVATTAHLRPAVRVEAGLALAAVPGLRGAMDVSDGLAADLPRFLAPGVGADIRLDPSWLHPEVVAHAASRGLDPAEAAFSGGEDYALLGAVAPEALPDLLRAVPSARVIGAVTAAPGIILNGRPVTGRGFDHFESSPCSS